MVEQHASTSAGSSVYNECLWRDVYRCVGVIYHDWFRELEETVMYCLKFVFIPRMVFFKSIVPSGYLVQLSNKSGCPGISEYPSSIRFKTKNLVVWTEPFERYFSTNCSQWHVPNNTRQTPNSKGFNCCKACKQRKACKHHDVHQVTEKCSESDRRKRLSVSSKYPI